MTETALNAEDAAAARAAEQARLRKERREAKIKAGGANRLNKITGLGGGLQRDAPAVPTTPDAVPQTRASQASANDDPAEVDISQHFYQPEKTARAQQQQGLDEARLRQMMLGFDQSPAGGFPGGAPPGMPGMPGMPGAEDTEDPMLRMMMQMMGGGGPGGPGGAGNPFSGAAGGPFNMPGMGGDQPPAVPDRYAALWRLLHTFVALGLGLYIAVWTGFSGTKLQRERGALEHMSPSVSSVDGDGGFQSKHFFWAFATAEAGLLTARFFADRARGPPAGILWTVAGFLPPPFKGYLATALRYGQMFGTVKADVLVCIFVLGVASWVRGGAW